MTTIDLERSDLANKADGVWGGRSEWKNGFLNDTSYLGDYSNEVVPVFAMDRILPYYENRWRGRNGLETHIGGNGGVPIANLYDDSKLKEYGFMYKIFNGIFRDAVTQILSADHPGAMPHRHWHLTYNDSNVITEVTNAIQQASARISIALSDCVSKTSEDFTGLPKEYGMPEISARHRWGRYWRYLEIVGHFLRGTGWEIHSTRTYIRNRRLTYLVGSYFIMDITDSDSLVPVIALVTKPKYLEYIKYSLALSKKIDKRVFQVWVNPLFDIPRSRWRGLRPHIRKEFLVPMYDAGIPIVEKDSFKELFKNIVIPKMANLNDYKKWLHECSIESINNLKTNIN